MSNVMPPPAAPLGLQPVVPQPTDDDDDFDTYRVSFTNMRKRTHTENYHVSALKKKRMVGFIKEPEYTIAQSTVSLGSQGSLAQSSYQGSQQGSQVSLTGASSQGSQSSLYGPNYPQSLAASQSSLTGYSPTGSQQNVPTSVGQPKQIPKTVRMPETGCYDTEAEVTRAGLGPIGPPKGSKMVKPSTETSRAIVKTIQDPLLQEAAAKIQTDVTMSDAIIQGAQAIAEAAAEAALSSPGQQLQPIQRNLPQ